MLMTTNSVPPVRTPASEPGSSLMQRLLDFLDVGPEEHGKMAIVAATIISVDTVAAMISVWLPRVLSGPTGILDLILGAPCFLIWWTSALILIDVSTKYLGKEKRFQSTAITLLYVGLLFASIGIRNGLIPLDQSSYLGRFLLQFVWYGVILTLIRTISLTISLKKAAKA